MMSSGTRFANTMQKEQKSGKKNSKHGKKSKRKVKQLKSESKITFKKTRNDWKKRKNFWNASKVNATIWKKRLVTPGRTATENGMKNGCLRKRIKQKMLKLKLKNIMIGSKRMRKSLIIGVIKVCHKMISESVTKSNGNRY